MQLFASGELRSTAPVSRRYEPSIEVPGATPTDPVCNMVSLPSKVTPALASTAKFWQLPKGMSTLAEAAGVDKATRVRAVKIDFIIFQFVNIYEHD